MAQAEVRVLRGDRVESRHRASAVIHDGADIVAAWGDPATVIYPRSAIKMMQALPLVEMRLEDDPRRLALACASHQGTAMHAGLAAEWLEETGWSEADLRCGAHMPFDDDARDALVRAGERPTQLHNNCSGKHAGFLALARRLGGGAEYVDVHHPVQRAVREAFEDVTGADSPGWAVDGCSAPNFAQSLDRVAAGAARFARAAGCGARDAAMVTLRGAMAAHPDLVAGEGRACTELMRAAGNGAVLKTGAEGVFVAILPAHGLGIVLKVEDGAKRASEALIAALLVRVGALDSGHPAAAARMSGPIRNWRGIATGTLEVALGR